MTELQGEGQGMGTAGEQQLLPRGATDGACGLRDPLARGGEAEAGWRLRTRTEKRVMEAGGTGGGPGREGAGAVCVPCSTTGLGEAPGGIGNVGWLYLERVGVEDHEFSPTKQHFLTI